MQILEIHSRLFCCTFSVFSSQYFSVFITFNVWAESSKYWMFISIFLLLCLDDISLHGWNVGVYIWCSSWISFSCRSDPFIDEHCFSALINQYFSHILSLWAALRCRADTQNFSIFLIYLLLAIRKEKKKVFNRNFWTHQKNFAISYLLLLSHEKISFLEEHIFAVEATIWERYREKSEQSWRVQIFVVFEFVIFLLQEKNSSRVR